MDKFKKSKEITKSQHGMMEHTISGPGRNWFGTNFNTLDSAEFDELVDMGLATKELAPDWMGDDVIYRLTGAGLRAIV